MVDSKDAEREAHIAAELQRMQQIHHERQQQFGQNLQQQLHEYLAGTRAKWDDDASQFGAMVKGHLDASEQQRQHHMAVFFLKRHETALSIKLAEQERSTAQRIRETQQ